MGARGNRWLSMYCPPSSVPVVLVEVPALQGAVVLHACPWIIAGPGIHNLLSHTNVSFRAPARNRLPMEIFACHAGQREDSQGLSVAQSFITTLYAWCVLYKRLFCLSSHIYAQTGGPGKHAARIFYYFIVSERAHAPDPFFPAPARCAGLQLLLPHHADINSYHKTIDSQDTSTYIPADTAEQPPYKEAS